MKLLELTSADGAKWVLPLSIIAASYADWLASNYVAGALHERLARAQADAAMCFEHTPNEACEWAQNSMNWSDVADHAVKVMQAEDPNMQDLWCNGHMEVIEGDMPAPEVLPTDPPQDKALAAWPFPTGHGHTLEPVKVRTLTQADIDAIRAEFVAQRNREIDMPLLMPVQAKAPALDANAVADLLPRNTLLRVYANLKDRAAELLARCEEHEIGDEILVLFAREAIREGVRAALAAYPDLSPQ